MSAVFGLDIDIITVVRGFYLLSAFAILSVRFTPALRDRFLDYGARGSSPSSHDASRSLISRCLDYIATARVPHSAFWHFYLLSILCTGLWVLLIFQGHLLDPDYPFSLFRDHALPVGARASTSPAKIGLCITLFWVHSLRRLRESLAQAKDRSSKSSMWIGHYFIGLAFYFVTNIAVLIEHAHILFDLEGFTNLFFKVNRGPSLLDGMAFFGFIVASKGQHEYHVYLSSLKKYTLPDKGAFRRIVAPHYTAECAIYLCLAILTAPAGQSVNATVLCTLVFAVVNLGVTADGTMRWMLGKFPDRRKDIESRWKMIPGVF